MTLHDRLLASLDPVRGRRLLDQIEQGVRPTARRRRIAAVMKPPGITYLAVRGASPYAMKW